MKYLKSLLRKLFKPRMYFESPMHYLRLVRKKEDCPCGSSF